MLNTFYLGIREGVYINESDSTYISNSKMNDFYRKEFENVICDENNNNSGKRSQKENLGLNSNLIAMKLNESLKKYEDFKNSLKTIYNLHSCNLISDNKITNFRDCEKNKNGNELIKNYEHFYLETTIEMFTEIFRSAK